MIFKLDMGVKEEELSACFTHPDIAIARRLSLRCAERG